jgi:hypothetical protein
MERDSHPERQLSQSFSISEGTIPDESHRDAKCVKDAKAGTGMLIEWHFLIE